MLIRPTQGRGYCLGSKLRSHFSFSKGDNQVHDSTTPNLVTFNTRLCFRPDPHSEYYPANISAKVKTPHVPAAYTPGNNEPKMAGDKLHTKINGRIPTQAG